MKLRVFLSIIIVSCLMSAVTVGNIFIVSQQETQAMETADIEIRDAVNETADDSGETVLAEGEESVEAADTNETSTQASSTRRHLPRKLKKGRRYKTTGCRIMLILCGVRLILILWKRSIPMWLRGFMFREHTLIITLCRNKYRMNFTIFGGTFINISLSLVLSFFPLIEKEALKKTPISLFLVIIWPMAKWLSQI